MGSTSKWLWAAAVVAAGIPAGAVESHAAGKPYVIYLSNNFVGNDWRQQMERVAQVAADKAPLKGRVELHIENAEGTVQAQINSLNNIIRTKPDAILIDAASGDALNPTIQKACDAKIVVVSFDQTVTAPCAYKMHTDFDIMANNQAEWLATELGGKGKILMDDGLAGAPISQQFMKNFAETFKKYPGIEVVGHFNGNYALGPEQQGVAALLAANPQVDGILTQAYGTGAIQALQNAGRPMVPVVAAAFNGTGVACAQQNVKCWLGANPPSLSAEAIKLATDVLDGKPPANVSADKTVLFNSPGLTTDPIDVKYSPNSTAVKIELGKTVFPDLPPGLSLPISPDWVTITPKEAAGS
ncbi:MAG TPA: substrate-binding domain-containing protein [Devosiaceae bacterium]|nr:substrate-binding domain-containing protein [Devosiaceae bacterium]